MSSKVTGARAFRKRLKQLPDAVSIEIVDVLNEGGQKIRAAMQARARRRTGKLAAGVKYQVLPKTLRLRVGLLGRKAGQQQDQFYGFILDKGRKAQTVLVRRFKRGAKRQYTRAGIKTGANLVTYRLRVRARRGDYFVSGRYRELREIINRRANEVFDRALKRIGGGARG